jgi:uncharacterized protein (TIGR00725 family)
MKKTMIGVMGPGNQATPIDLENAYQLGQLIAQEGWVLLTGGRKAGVMDKANRGAKDVGGLTVGILPTDNTEGMSDGVDIAILTDLGNSRNNINVLSSDVVIACGMGLGTASEIALALKNGKFVVILAENRQAYQFFLSLSPNQVLLALTPLQTIEKVKAILKDN